MIGQRRLSNYIDLVKDDFPSFTVLIGPTGSGKRTLAKKIATTLGATYVSCGIKVDEIREMIDTASVLKERTLFCIENADLMRNEAKNAMLKITEEPPKDIYFVLTVCNAGTLLDTIVSRAQVLKLDPYSVAELEQYWQSKYDSPLHAAVCTTATTPYEVDLMMEYGQEFLDYVNLVIDNIAEVESANAFKSSSRLALKSGQEGYDLKLFWETFMSICLDRVKSDVTHYSMGILTTLPYIEKVSTRTGVNLQQLYDMWVFDIRKAWL